MHGTVYGVHWYFMLVIELTMCLGKLYFLMISRQQLRHRDRRPGPKTAAHAMLEINECWK